MIPIFDVETVVSYRPTDLRVPHPQEMVDGFTATHEYRHLEWFEWSAVKVCLDAERDVLARADRIARSAEQYDALIEASQDEASEDLDEVYFALDIGTAGLVLALCAAGGVTFYSCRGALPGSYHHAKFPQIGVTLDPQRAAEVARLAEEAHCGFELDERGYVWIHGRQLDHMHDLATRIYSSRLAFDAMGRPDWFDQVKAIYDDRAY